MFNLLKRKLQPFSLDLKSTRPVVYVLGGLPGSGKTTLAKQMIEESFKRNRLMVRFNYQEMRRSLYGMNAINYNDRLHPDREQIIQSSVDGGIECAIDNGFDVIIDNVNIQYGSFYRHLLKLNRQTIKVIICRSSARAEVCIINNNKRPPEERVPEAYIHRMDKGWHSNKAITQAMRDDGYMVEARQFPEIS